MRLSSNSFICKYNNCKKYLKEPIILPCGRSICREHVDNLSKNKSEPFLKCNLCDQIHKKTDDFQLNVTLKELLEEGTHLDEKQIEMRQLYDNFELTLKELDRIKRDPNNYLFDYVNEQKRKVELQREELKLQIDKIAEDLIKKIDDLNDKCCKQVCLVQQVNIDSFKKEAEKYSKNHIRNPNIDKAELNQLITNLKSVSQKAEIKLSTLKRKLTNNTVFEFEANFKKFKRSDFGSFMYRPDVELTKSKELIGHKLFINCAIYYPKNKLITGSDDQTIKIWDLNSGECLVTLTNDGNIDKLILAENNRLVSASGFGVIKLFCLNSYECLTTKKDDESDMIKDVCVTKNNYLITSNMSGHCKVWDLNTLEYIKRLPDEFFHYENLNTLDETKLIGTISSPLLVSEIIVFNLDEFKEEYRLARCLNSIYCLHLFKNNLKLLSSHDDGIRLWNLSTRQLIKTIKSDNAILDVNLLRNESYILANDKNSQLFLCDLNNDYELKLSNPINKQKEPIDHLLAVLPNQNIVTTANQFSVSIYDNLFKDLI